MTPFPPMNDNLSAFGFCQKHQKHHVFMPGNGKAFQCPVCVESAARIATASSDPGCPLKAIVNDIATGLEKDAETRPHFERTWERWGELGVRGSELSGDAVAPLRPAPSCSAPSPQAVSALRASVAIAEEK